jgi:hypothetical protein
VKARRAGEHLGHVGEDVPLGGFVGLAERDPGQRARSLTDGTRPARDPLAIKLA